MKVPELAFSAPFDWLTQHSVPDYVIIYFPRCLAASLVYTSHFNNLHALNIMDRKILRGLSENDSFNSISASFSPVKKRKK